MLISLLSSPASFQRRFGDPVPVTPQTPEGYSLSAAWQTGLGQGGSMSHCLDLFSCFRITNPLLQVLGQSLELS